MLPKVGNDNITFGYQHRLKDLYKRGLLPLKYGFYGGKLTKQNVSLEHLQPHSKGGKTELYNLVLATKENNNLRGNGDITPFLSEKNLFNYLTQFKNIKLKGFDGNKYIQDILRTITKLIGD